MFRSKGPIIMLFLKLLFLKKKNFSVKVTYSEKSGMLLGRETLSCSKETLK